MSRVQRLYWGFRIPHSLFRVGLVVALLLGMLPSQAGASSIQPEQYIPSGQGSQQATEPGPVPTPLPPAEWPETLPFRHSPYTPSFELPQEVETLVLPPVQSIPVQEVTTPSDTNEELPLGLPPGAVTLTLAPEGGQVTVGELPLALESATGSLAQPVQARINVLDSDIAEQLSPVQVAFQLSFASLDRDGTRQPLAQPGQPLELSLDTSRLALPYGGSFADRLMLYRVSDCAWRTVTPEQTNDMPARPQSEEQVLDCSRWEALPGVNDRANQRLTVTLVKLDEMENGLVRQSAVPEQKGNPLFLPLVGGGGGVFVKRKVIQMIIEK